MADHLKDIQAATAEVRRHEMAAPCEGKWAVEVDDHGTEFWFNAGHLSVGPFLAPLDLPEIREAAALVVFYRTMAPRFAAVLDEWAGAIAEGLRRYGDQMPEQMRERLQELLAGGAGVLSGDYPPGDGREAALAHPVVQEIIQQLEDHVADRDSLQDEVEFLRLRVEKWKDAFRNARRNFRHVRELALDIERHCTAYGGSLPPDEDLRPTPDEAGPS